MHEYAEMCLFQERFFNGKVFLKPTKSRFVEDYKNLAIEFLNKCSVKAESKELVGQGISQHLQTEDHDEFLLEDLLRLEFFGPKKYAINAYSNSLCDLRKA